MPKPNKQIIIDAIVSEIETGTERGKVVAKYCKKFQKSARTIDTYWKTANQQHTVQRDAIKKELSAIDTQSAVDARKSGLKSKAERVMSLQQQYEACLRELKSKKLSLLDKIALRKCYKELQSEVSKIEGDYAPNKFTPTDGEGNYVPPFTDHQVDKIIFSLEGREN